MIRTARPEDLADALALLGESKLPTAGVEEAFDRFVVAERAGEIVGVAGLEAHGNVALLRSVAVAPTERGRGLGGALTEELLRRASQTGIDEVYLLTETAADFFPRYGFERIDRSAADPAIRTSAEFTTLCATTATVMVRRGIQVRHA